MNRRINAASIYLVAAVVTTIAAVTVIAAPSQADPVLSGLELAQTTRANCQVLLAKASSSAQRNRANNCIADQTVIINALTPQPSATPTVSPTVTASPTPTPSPTPSPSPTVTTPPPPPGPRVCPDFPAMPDASCTGVPQGVSLRACSIPFGTVVTHGQVIDGCIIQGGLTIQANNVTIRNTVIRGGRVNAGYGSQSGLVLTDVEIDGQNSDPNGQSGIGDNNYTCIRCNVHNTGRGAAVGSNVTIRDSYFHDFAGVPGAHMSAAGSNGGANNVIVHNTLDCVSVTGQGACSGAFVMYGDFAPIDNWLIQNNWFASPGSYCVYAGSDSSGAKPFPHATRLTIVDNLWSRKYTAVCGEFGPVTGWEPNTGSTWTGNRYTDGQPITV